MNLRHRTHIHDLYPERAGVYHVSQVFNTYNEPGTMNGILHQNIYLIIIIILLSLLSIIRFSIDSQKVAIKLYVKAFILSILLHRLINSNQLSIIG